MATDPFNYAEARDDADGLIADFGTAAAVRRNVASGTVFDPVLTPTDYPTLAVRVEFTWKQLQGSDVLSTDQRWLVAAGPLTALGVGPLLPSDALVVSGNVVGTLLKSGPLDPTAAFAVMYDCQVRL